MSYNFVGLFLIIANFFHNIVIKLQEYYITQSRENRKGGGFAVIYKSHLHNKKLSFKEFTSFEAVTVKLDITTKSYILSTIYRAPYSIKQQVTVLTFLEEFPDHISSLFRSSKISSF